MAIRAVGFDYGGVIAGQPGSIFAQSVADFLGVSLRDFQLAYFKYNIALNRAEVGFTDFWKKVLEELGKEENLSQLLNFVKRQPEKGPNRKILKLVRVLKESGYKVGF